MLDCETYENNMPFVITLGLLQKICSHTIVSAKNIFIFLWFYGISCIHDSSMVYSNG